MHEHPLPVFLDEELVSFLRLLGQFLDLRPGEQVLFAAFPNVLAEVEELEARVVDVALLDDVVQFVERGQVAMQRALREVQFLGEPT
jgi:hypothetical protein